MSANHAFAGQDDVRLLPTMVPQAAEAGAAATLARPAPGDERLLARWARHLDGILSEAVQDLGLTLDVSGRASEQGVALGDDELVASAAESWVISPRLSLEGGSLRIRIVAVAPGSRVLLMRSQELEPRDVEIRAMVMLRDVVQSGRGEPSERTGAAKPPADERAVVYHARSRGRAVLALNAAALGGFVGFTIQRASTATDEDPDPRLTYPLIALGTGIGLGASMIVADEWDVGIGDAWFLSAGIWWPGAAGLLLAHGYEVDADERYLYGLAGAASGVTLATVALTFAGMGEGGALLTHSGGAFGMLLGGVTQLAIEGRTDETPTLGMGYGTGIGVLAAGALATQVRTSPSRILLIDLGASLGALTGAAAASPLLLVGDEPTEGGRDRAWLASVAAGTVVGGAIAWWATRPTSAAGLDPAHPLALVPWAGIVAEARGPNGERGLAPGGGVRGAW